ncbi:MAG: TonB-dependent receptor plug [Caulobacter sp.]|nr:TonB-dependent receptor plug [Caulobacter sp.]
MSLAAKWASTVILALAAAAGSLAHAQDAPAQEPTTASEVVITARKPQVTDRIDRRVYDVEADPLAQVGQATDILRRLPSVTVTPDGGIALRGDYGVSILINGRPAPSGAMAQLPANQIASIEVITNPSAQFAPDGTAGIINVVLRKKHPIGVSGQVSASVDTRGSRTADLTASLNSGRWNLSGGANLGEYLKRSTSHRQLQLFDINGATLNTIASQSRSNFDWRLAQANAAAAFKLTPTITLTLSGRLSHSLIDTHGVENSAGLNPLDTFTQHAGGRQRSDERTINLVFDYASPDGATTFSADGMRRGLDRNNDQNFIGAYASLGLPPSTTHSLAKAHDISTLWEGGYTRRFPNGRLLTAGLSWRLEDSRSARSFVSTDVAVTSYTESFSGSESQMDAYVTFQFSAGDWVLLPGLRIESITRSFDTTTGLPQVRETDLFPSFHLSRDLGERAKLKFSYSRRVDRNDIQDYDPTITFRGTRTARSGNPGLRPQIVDSFEASFHYDRRDFGFVTSAYFRRKDNDVETIAQDLGNGVVLYRPVNTAGSRTGGFEFTIHGPFGAGALSHLRYSVNTNVFYARVPRLDGSGGTRRDTVSWSGNGMIEYVQDLTGQDGDRVQLSIDATGPRYTAQAYESGYVEVDLAYLHPVNPRWTLSVSLTDLTNSSGGYSTYSNASLYDRTDRPPSNRTAKLSLVRKF